MCFCLYFYVVFLNLIILAFVILGSRVGIGNVKPEWWGSFWQCHAPFFFSLAASLALPLVHTLCCSHWAGEDWNIEYLQHIFHIPLWGSQPQPPLHTQTHTPTHIQTTNVSHHWAVMVITVCFVCTTGCAPHHGAAQCETMACQSSVCACCSVQTWSCVCLLSEC